MTASYPDKSFWLFIILLMLFISFIIISGNITAGRQCVDLGQRCFTDNWSDAGVYCTGLADYCLESDNIAQFFKDNIEIAEAAGQVQVVSGEEKC